MSLATFVSTVKGLFTQSATAVAGVVNGEELLKAIVTAVSTGASSGTVLAAVAAVIPDVAMFIPNPAIAGLVATVLTLIVQLYAKKAQGAVVPGVTPGVAKIAP